MAVLGVWVAGKEGLQEKRLEYNVRTGKRPPASVTPPCDPDDHSRSPDSGELSSFSFPQEQILSKGLGAS